MANTHDNLSELFSGIAAAIRSKTGSTAKIKADNFPSAINAIEAGSGGITPVDTITIIANGNYDVTQYAEAVVEVPSSGGDIVNGEDIEVDSLSKLHSWSKYRIAGSVYETKVDTLSISSTGVNDTHYEPLDYASEYDTSSGKIVLVNPTENVTLKSTAAANVILGKYIQTYAKPNQYEETSSPTGNYYRIDSTATVNYSKNTYPVSGEGLTVSPAYRLTYTGSEEQFVGIVVSEDSTAYPQNGTQDGYKYVYNGTLDSTSAVLKTLDVTPSATQQVIDPPTGYDGFSKVTVVGDADLVAGNIKKDVNIFGVTGTYEGVSGTALPTLTDPGTADDLAKNKQLIDANGNVVTGSVATYDTYQGWSNRTPIQVNDSVRLDRESGVPLLMRKGFYLASPLSNFGYANREDVRAGKTFTSAAGLAVEGNCNFRDIKSITIEEV